MKLLLIGKTGQLGGSILKLWSGQDIIAPGRDELDIGSRQSIEDVVTRYVPDVVVNTAAFHNVPLCEDETGSAFAVNCVAVRDLAAVCKRSGSRLVTFSSDYVFGGDKRTPYLEGDKLAPLQMYGISRAAGEYAAMATTDNVLVIRTCGLYGVSGAKSKGGNFVDKRLSDAATQKVMEMGSDQFVAPTYTDDLASAVLALIVHQDAKPGIYHLVNEGECSWYEFTRAIYEIAGLDVEVKPVDRGGMTGAMRRPLYSVLANTKARDLGIVLPHWRNALERYIKAKHGE